LERLGVSGKGAIVIARYGRSWRGIKPKVAYEHGAVGCLIYSDLRDDGYFDGEVFPEGPMRNRDGVQRGSVMDMTLYRRICCRAKASWAGGRFIGIGIGSF
jgi:N-acetylated-alpha-linked acidic dipeptidase